LADRIIRLASDPELRLKMSQENRRLVDDFHPKRIVEKIGNAIEETIKLGSNTK
jgi:glycosyltransferase involved in cell wall biosynthesis